MKELNHPQIVDLVTTYQDETSIHMLMRLIPYGELWDRMHIEDDEGNWTSGVPEDHAKFYTVSIADTLSFIHSRGIVYRDLKPENVLIDVDGYPVIVDFGCSKFCPDKTYTFVGTPNYVAPEMITNAGHNRGVDIWALGVVVYEMVTGENPFFFEGVDQISLYHSICHEDFFPIPEDQSRESVDFIDRLLKKDPLERLGMLRAGMKDILDHQWLEGIPLSQIRNKSYSAPWKPTELVHDGFENFYLEESMKSYSSIVSTEATEAQELSHSSRQDLIQDSITSFPRVTLTEGRGDIQKHSNSSSISKPEDIQFSADSETALEIEDPSGPPKPKKKGKKLKTKSRKGKEKEPKPKESPKSKEASFLDKFYTDPSDFQSESIKRTHVIRNPNLRKTLSQKRERASRKDFLKSSFDNFGID
uniref:Protein kinase domain-containing protein n=1 Tax=Pseudo-nitzschia delicatissima TaxID=44447 RepID=A0A7S0Y8D0_9STRA